MRRGILTLAIANIASKPVGLLRQMVFAMFYGVTAVMSACRFAQTITLAFMNFFATDTLNAGFLPLYERYKKNSPELAQSFFWFLFSLLLILSSIVFVLLYAGAPLIVHWFAPGFSGMVVSESIQFIRVFSFAVPFCLLGTLFSYLAMSAGAYSGLATRPIFESGGLIVGVLLSVWRGQIMDIAWAFVAAYILFFLMIAYTCFRDKHIAFISRKIWRQHASVFGREFWLTIRPLLALPLFMQGKFIIEKMVASLMAVSVVAALDYARFIIDTGINIIAAPIGLIGLSAFSLVDGKKLADKLELLVTVMMNIGVPITLFIAINAKLVVAVLYGYGAFDAYAIDQASLIFSGMALTFFAQIVGYTLIKILSAKLQNHRVMYYLVTAIVFDVLFIVLSFRSLGPIALGIGESIYALIVFVLCVNYFNLFSHVRNQLFFLMPVSAFYFVAALYLENVMSHSRWTAFFEQTLLFSLVWGLAFLINKRTRQLFFEKVWSNE